MSANVTPALVVWDASCPTDLAQWLAAWQTWPEREVFAHPHYVSLYAEGDKVRALCAHAELADVRVLYPFLLRDISAEPFWTPEIGAAADIITPYGYGGPYVWGHGDIQWAAEQFWSAFNDWTSHHHVVSELVRFTVFSDMLLPYPGDELRFPNVVRDLNIEEGALLADFKPAARTNIRVASRNSLSVECDSTGECLDEFLAVYEHTMNRRQARLQYYFPRNYFERLHRTLSGQFMYFWVAHHGKLLAAELTLLSRKTVYSLLAGSYRYHLWLRPNEILKYQIMRWARAAGKQRYVLGGGLGGQIDGIFDFKKSFAPNGVRPFRIGRRIFSKRLYDALVQNRKQQARRNGCEWQPASGFFPLYRA